VRAWIPTTDVTAFGEMPILFVLDTGSPFTIFDTGYFPMAAGVVSPDPLVDTFLSSYTVPGPIAYDLGGPIPPGAIQVVGGILGYDFLGTRALVLDYHDENGWVFATLAGDPPVASSTGASSAVTFSLLGGGGFSIPGDGATTAPATRVVVDGTVEGVAVTMMLDTGASASIVHESLLAALFDPARPQLDGVEVSQAGTAIEGGLTRLGAVTVGGATVSGAPALVLPGSALVDGLASETGAPIQLLLGGTWLRYFLVTVNYPASELRFAPYTDTSHVNPDEWIGPGFEVSDGPGTDFEITDVYTGTDAESQGVMVGDLIAEFEGASTLGMPLDAFRLMLTSYTPGTSLDFGFRVGPSIVTVPVLVEDLLPVYP
jgi:hypothetical protein